MNRRNFLKKIFYFISFILLGGILTKRKWDIFSATMDIKDTTKRAGLTRTGNRDIVSIEKCADYNADDIYTALKKSLDAINFKIPEKKKILLKPNILAQNTPEQATTTHPAVIEAVCRIFKENNCKIYIGESSAFYQGGCTRLGFETAGIAAAGKKYDAEILPFETTLLKIITTGKELNPFYITQAVFDCDLVVNLPKLKIHRLARYSGAIKNTYGCVVGGTKQIYHKLFQARSDYQEFWGKPLVDVYEAVNPGLTIMDAIVGLDEDGPAANGKPKFTGLLFSSRNGVSLDTVVCRVIGFDPRWVPAVREALDRGMASPDNIIIAGEILNIPYVKLTDIKPKTGISKKFDDYIFDQFIVTPVISESKCKKCNSCAEKCAPQAIRLKSDGYPQIDISKCIYCYCCSEYCPHDAISLSGGVINHFIRGFRQILKL